MYNIHYVLIILLWDLMWRKSQEKIPSFTLLEVIFFLKKSFIKEQKPVIEWKREISRKLKKKSREHIMHF